MPEPDCVKRGSLPNDATLKMWLDNEEQSWGGIVSLRVVGGENLACFKFPLPALKSLAVKRMIGDSRPPTPAGHAHIVDGEALIQNVKVGFSLFRKN